MIRERCLVVGKVTSNRFVVHILRRFNAAVTASR